MSAIVNTLAFDHNLLLVLVAACICALSALAAIMLMGHSRRQTGNTRLMWLIVAACSTGAGIWSTHFIAMLAFDSGMPTGYDIGLTALSLLIAVIFSGLGMYVAVMAQRASDVVLGGAVAGLGISAMHFTGMASLLVGGAITWDHQLVSISILSGMVLDALAFVVAMKARTWGMRILASILMTLAICSMHFTAMAAAGFENCFAIVGEHDPVTSVLLPAGVALASLLILGFALGGAVLEMREARRAEQETERLHDLANAAVEGLVICNNEQIATINSSFASIIGVRQDQQNLRIDQFLDHETIGCLHKMPGQPLETEIKPVKGRPIPVEVVFRQLGMQINCSMPIR